MKKTAKKRSKMARLDPNGMLNLCQIKPKYVKITDILTDRFDSIDESKESIYFVEKAV